MADEKKKIMWYDAPPPRIDRTECHFLPEYQQTEEYRDKKFENLEQLHERLKAPMFEMIGRDTLVKLYQDSLYNAERYALWYRQELEKLQDSDVSLSIITEIKEGKKISKDSPSGISISVDTEDHSLHLCVPVTLGRPTNESWYIYSCALRLVAEFEEKFPEEEMLYHAPLCMIVRRHCKKYNLHVADNDNLETHRLVNFLAGRVLCRSDSPQIMSYNVQMVHDGSSYVELILFSFKDTKPEQAYKLYYPDNLYGRE